MQDDYAVIQIDPQEAVSTYYGDNELVAAFVDRLTPLYKGADRQTVQLIAQLAIATGANPLPSSGEIWTWPQWDSQTRGYKLTVMLGVQYYRRNIADQSDVLSFVSPPDLMSEARAMKHGASDKDIVAECTGYLQSQYAKLRQNGFSMVEAERRLTRRGIGRVAYEEMFVAEDMKDKNGRVYKKAGTPFNPPKGRTWLWVAEKRAEKDLLTKIVTPSNPLTARIQEMNRRNLQILQRADAELPENAQGHAPVDLDDLNEQLFDAHSSKKNRTAVIEGEVTESPQTVEQEYVGPFGKQGNVPEPTDWVAEMLRAKTLDEWAYRAYQSDWGKATLRDANHAKKFALTLLDNNYLPDSNGYLVEELEHAYESMLYSLRNNQEEPDQEPEQEQTGEIERPFADGVIPTNWRQKALKAPNLSQFVAAVEQMGLGYRHQKHIRNTLKGLDLTWKDNGPKTLLEALETYKGDDEG